MAETIANFQDIRFDPSGRPYWLTTTGRPSYLAPIMAAEAAGLFSPDAAATATTLHGAEAVQRLKAYATANGVTAANPSGNAPRNTFAHQNNGWNPATGQYDVGMNQGGLGGAIEGGAAVAAPFALSALTAAPAAAGGASAGDYIIDSVPGWTPAASGGGGSSLVSAIGSGLAKHFSDPKVIASIAGMAIPAFTGGGSSTGANGALGADSPLMQGATEDMAAARRRYQQAQPLYDALVNIAYGRTPTRYRGAAPSGYPETGDAAPAGAYQYVAPRFN